MLKETSALELQFLTELSLLESFTEDEATQISNGPDVPQRIKSLLNKKILSLLSETPSTYQINNLIREELRTQLATNAKHFKEIAVRSGNILRERRPLKALELFALGDDLKTATEIATTNLQHIIYQADMDLLSKWAPTISRTMSAGATGEKLINAYGLYATGKFEQTRAILRELESSHSESPLSEVLGFEMNLLRLRLSFVYGRFDEVIEKVRSLTSNGVSSLNRRVNSHFSLFRNALVASFYIQDTQTFNEIFKKAIKELGGPNSSVDHIALNSFKAMNAFLSGHYLEANEYALAACRIADELGVRGSYFPYESAYILMDTYLEFGEDEKSQRYVDEYLPLAMKAHQYPWIAAFHAKSALIKLQSGRIQAALATIRKGREFISGSLFGPLITLFLDGHELLICMNLGERERINELIFRLPDSNALLTYKIGLEIMMKPGEFNRLVELIPESTLVDKFRKKLLLATALSANPSKAIEHLEEAIEIAIPNGYFRAFLNLPPNIKTMILDISAKNPSIYMENLARAIRDQIDVLTNSSHAMDIPLTKRELVILRRLATGLPITQIASSLDISRNTIKTHLKSVYRKLNVESRHEAVIKGKELLLL